MAADVAGQQFPLQGGRQIGVRIAQQAGEIVGGRAAAHALGVDPDGLAAAEEDVAGLSIAMDQGLRRFREKARNRIQFGRDGGDLPGRRMEAIAEHVVDEIGVFPGVELGVEPGHARQAFPAGGGQAAAVQAQKDFQELAIHRPDFGGGQPRQPGFQGVRTEIFDGQQMIAGGVEQEARDGNAEGAEEPRVAGVKAVVGAFRGPADEDRGGAAYVRPEEFAAGAARNWQM